MGFIKNFLEKHFKTQMDALRDGYVKSRQAGTISARKWDHAQQKWIDLGVIAKAKIEKT